MRRPSAARVAEAIDAAMPIRTATAGRFGGRERRQGKRGDRHCDENESFHIFLTSLSRLMLELGDEHVICVHQEPTFAANDGMAAALRFSRQYLSSS
jgi:hypothetical protein